MSADVEFAAPAVESLLHNGALDAEWLDAFHRLPEAGPRDQSSWEPAFFRLRHFVVMYLPLRYEAWAKLNGIRRHETERQLADLIRHVSVTLWRDACAASIHDSRSEGLVELVLGDGNPLRLEGDARRAWDARYLATLGEISDWWKGLREWPRWAAMALHFAGFYLPLGLLSFAHRPSDPLIDSLEDELDAHLHPDVAQLVVRWLELAAAERDSAGIPVAGLSAARPHSIVGRTETELLLFGGSVGRASR